MDLVKNILAYLKGKESGAEAKAPEGVCPNCWGKQEYDGVVRELVEDKQIDVNNHSANHAFIQDFVVNHVNGIQLKKGNSGLVCSRCHTEYPV